MLSYITRYVYCSRCPSYSTFALLRNCLLEVAASKTSLQEGFLVDFEVIWSSQAFWYFCLLQMLHNEQLWERNGSGAAWWQRQAVKLHMDGRYVVLFICFILFLKLSSQALNSYKGHSTCLKSYFNTVFDNK